MPGSLGFLLVRLVWAWVGRVVLGSLLLGDFAGVAWAHGPLHEQISALDEQIAGNPGNAGLHLSRADLHRLDGNAVQAIEDLGIAERLSPGLPAVWWVRARVLIHESRFEAALADLDRWLAVHPDNEDALVARASVRDRTGDPDGAIDDYSRAMAAVKVPDPDTILARARADRRRGDRYLEHALQGLDEGIARVGNLVVLQLEAADLELALGRIDGALARLDTLLAGAARKESWHARRAELLERADRGTEAQAEWARALSACLGLPPRLRQSRSVQELEERVRRKLPAALQSIAEKTVFGSRSAESALKGDRAISLTNLRTVPPHASSMP